MFEGDERVNLNLGNMTMDADRELPKYYIEEDSPRLIQISQREVQMEIVFKRRLLTETVRTFFPSLLLVCFSYATSFFRLPNFFTPAIAANLTVMLTMTNLMDNLMKRLGETAQIKWIELWLIFTQCVPFVQVILITIIEWLRNEEEMEEKKKKADNEDIVMERGKEMLEMHVGGKQVKVNTYQNWPSI